MQNKDEDIHMIRRIYYKTIYLTIEIYTRKENGLENMYYYMSMFYYKM